MNKFILALSMTAYSSPALACERDPTHASISRLPGETEEAAISRYSQIDHDIRLVDRVQTERRYVEHAPEIYLAEVVSRLDGERGAVVKPLKAFRGRLPQSPMDLVFVPGSLCTGDEISDGEGWRGKPGELVVIFEGLKRTMWRPNGVDSLLATSVRSSALVRWIQQFGTVIKRPEADSE